ncbi:Chromosome-associated kinesin KIF4 [Frankliniella fusca]|uniref:Chromosome-associated kinesin KIF4 n=1 Tax=Frankliniella fusca TaxID=407009 RepID=A0AAE1LHK9_9NEOP|nr:Chromosome-associated kinesin KIF4 [Frankliniella fusca]
MSLLLKCSILFSVDLKMSKHAKNLKTPAPENLVCGTIKWGRCLVCQSTETNGLINPSNNRASKDVPAGYQSLAAKFEDLQQLNYVLPSNLPIESLDPEGIGLSQSFIKNEGKYHKSCYSNYFGEKLERIKKQWKKTCEMNAEESDDARRTTRSSLPLNDLKQDICFLCSGTESKKNALHRAETKSIHRSVSLCAQILQDEKLLALLSAGDLVAQEAKYHKNCLSALYNQCREVQRTGSTSCAFSESIAFAELVGYIKGKLESESTEYVFKIPDLLTMYHKRLSELLGVSADSMAIPHSSRFRSKLLTYLPELQELKSGREYILVRNSANLHHDVLPEDFDGDAIAFQRFIKSLRKEISASPIKFNGTLEDAAEAIPPPLIAVVETLLYGSAMTKVTKPALTISQIILFNFHKVKPKSSSGTDNFRHSKAFEPTLPLRLGLLLYGDSRNKRIIDILHKEGLSISNNRVMEITSSLCKLVVERSKEENVVCPSNLKKNVFTVAAIDNVDYNPSSTTSRGSFHGTSISLFQLVASDADGVTRTFQKNYNDVDTSGYRGVPMLPDSYATVPDFVLPKKDATPGTCSEDLGSNMIYHGTMLDTIQREEAWLQHLKNLITNEDGGGIGNISWSAFHASREFIPHAPSINALLPLFYESASTAPMIYHGMKIVKNTTSYLNPAQIPIMIGDQPLFALAKLLQWNCPQEFSEDKFVVLFGHFHIEQNFLQLMGKFMKSGGWVGVAVNSGIIDVGSAEAILTVKHVTKSRLMHEVTCAVLFTLMHEAYEFLQPDQNMSFDTFLEDMAAKCPTFKYWLTTFKLEIILLNFVRSIRSGDYKLFKTALKQMMPWFFTFDHTNYARWVAVHIKDLEELPDKAPSVHQEFCSGNFVVHKTANAFSGLAIDQAHEQHNAMAKGPAGIIGLTQDPSSLRRFTVAGPEVSSILSRFEASETLSQLMKHHESFPSFQKRFLENCVAMRDSFNYFGNPFLEQGAELLALDTRVATIQKSVSTLYTLENLGQEMYNLFIKERFVEGTVSVHSPIKKSNIKIFDAKEKKTTEVSNLKSEVQLFSRLFIVAREREMDLDNFFAHENQIYPPAISLSGKLRTGTKADLVEKLESLVTTEQVFNNSCDAIIYDGAALVQMVRPTKSNTFEDYYSAELKAYVSSNAHSSNSSRVDFVWDMYLPGSLKTQERDSRGLGVRRSVVPNGVLPKNWADFLRNAQNKSELFQFLGSRFVSDFSEAKVVTNVGDTVCTSEPECTSLCGKTIFMEEADGRILWHVKDSAEHGAKIIVIRSSDTDVLVISISFYHELKLSGLHELWILSGVGTKRRYIAVHKIAEVLGEEKSVALRGFHAYTGCDTTAYFAGKGKKTCFKTWTEHEEFTAAFAALSKPSEVLHESTIQQLEKFVCRLYDPASDEIAAVKVRSDMFATKNKLVQFIPPTAPVLKQKALRSLYQAGHIWGNSLHCDLSPPLPSSWGWKSSSKGWEPIWSLDSYIWEELSFLDRCGCKTKCGTYRCTCKKSGVRCTLQCSGCKGDCENNKSSSSGAEAPLWTQDDEDLLGDA